ncbi:MFS transporter [Paracoccus sp. TK19116]|uniref:MFS transporter n=2 Tax=Paracoccus albicereus TaxID=2922394 RepID=A0ABT1MNQ2_9RHOB|nr:MFS transporter [Paracoccus albicereus]
MGIARDLYISRRPVAGLAAIGIFWGSFAAWLPEIKTRAGVSDAEFGVLMMLSAVGGMSAMMAAPWLRRRIGPTILPLSGLIFAIVASSPALVHGRTGLAAALLVIGASMSLCDILSNIRISDIEAREGRSLMNLNHAIYSLALAASAAIMGIFRAVGVPHALAAGLIVLVILGLVIVMRGARPLRDTAEREAEPSGIGAPWLIVLPGAAILWLSFVVENGVESWGAIHIERTLEVAGGLGSFGPAMFGLAMGLARLAGQGLTQTLGEVRLIAFSVCMAAIGTVALALAPVIGIAIFGAAAAGLGVAVVVPTANSLIARTVPAGQRASAIARAWMMGFTGFFIGPPLMGLISEAAGLRAAFGLLACAVVLMLPCLWLLARRLRGRPATAQRA